ncbi:MAG: hypothetical protein ACFB5Z_01335 [Elainellaceae cyanobacterium]
MPRAPIVDPAETYTFCKYAELKFDTADILAEFDVLFKTVSLQLPQRRLELRWGAIKAEPSRSPSPLTMPMLTSILGLR